MTGVCAVLALLGEVMRYQSLSSMQGYFGGKGLPFFWTTIPGAETANGAVPQPPDSISFFFFFFITLGLELSDTKVYEP